MYGEDIDLSYRLLKGGWENWYLPLMILHYKGESTQKSSFRYVHVFYESMLIFFEKHFGHLSWLLTAPVQSLPSILRPHCLFSQCFSAGHAAALVLCPRVEQTTLCSSFT